jgi:trimeric autotransporter adhesin
MKKFTLFFLLSLISFKGFSQDGAIFFRIFTCPSPKGNGFEWYIKNAGTQPAPCAIVKKVIWGKDSASIHFDSDTVFVGSCIDAKTQSVPARVAMFDNGKLVACIPPWGTGGGSGTVTNIATSTGITGGPITTTGTLKADTSLLSTKYYAGSQFYPLSNPSGYTSNAGTVTQVNAGYGTTFTSITTTGTVNVDTSTNILNPATQGYVLRKGYGTGSVTSVATGLGLSGGTITTTGTLLVDTASASILSRQRAANTYAPISVNGTVTSVATGSGLTGGTITTTGTIKADTSLLATKYYTTTEKRVSIQFSSIALGAPADATNYYYGSYPGLAPTTTAGARGFVIPTACTITAASLSIIFTGTNPTSENVSFFIRRANTTDYTISTTVNMSVGANVPIYVVATGLSVPINGTASDFIEIKMTTPAWVTNPTNVFVSGVLYGTE